MHIKVRGKEEDENRQTRFIPVRVGATGARP
jgi:hypothetical protein